MDTALTQINAFLTAIVPFDQLSEPVTASIASKLSICYVVSGEQLPPIGITDNRLYIVRKGALSYFNRDNELLGKFGEGDVCTVFSTPKSQNQLRVNCEEDSLLYSINYEKLIELLANYPSVVDFFTHSAEQRLKLKMTQVNEEAVLASSLVNACVSQFYNSPVATIEQDMTIREAAIKMTERRYSCLVITHGDLPVGIVTDKDIRQRCVAEGISADKSVRLIMTDNIFTLDIKSNAYDALMLMSRKNIHHLPVTRNHALLGMVTMTDLINNEGQNTLNITAMIHKANTMAELIQISQLLPKLQQRMEKAGNSAEHVGQNISAITMALTIRLIKMAEHTYGQAPVPYAWLAAGSQARQEQLSHSDQDNALIISDQVQPEQMQWFKDLARFVCDGLALAGFCHCPGEIMATNSLWRQTQSRWSQYFNQWIDTPDPEALLNCTVFFDLDTVYGDQSLLAEVKQNMLAKTQSSSLFIAHLSANALRSRPPLGFFRDFVLIQDGENNQTLDLKHSGIAPIVDLARIYALSEGISATNTLERLRQAAGTASLTQASGASLIDAFGFLTQLRLQHQVKRLQSGQTANNYLSPKEISPLEREHLKAAFKVIKTLQDVRQKTL